MCTGGQIITDMHLSLRLFADWESLQLLHGCFELCNIACWVSNVVTFGGVKNSPGRRKVVPYTSSAILQLMSFSTLRMPCRTMGRESIQ